MPSTNKTPSGLNQWLATDKPEMEDFNADNLTIDALVEALKVSGVPTGTILPYAGTTAPTGFVLCQGQAISRTTYAKLFTICGTTYGIGNGTTTFNVPDMRGRVPVGCDANFALGSKGGSQTQTLSISNIKPFNLNLNIYPAEGGSRPGGISGYTNNGINNNQYSTAVAGSGTPISMMQPYMATNYIIKT